MFMDINSMMPYERSCNSCETKPSCGCLNESNAQRESIENVGNCGTSSSGHTWGLKNYPLASVYAPLQSFDKLFDLDTALSRGTIFTELDLPFLGESVYKGGICRG